MRYLKLFESCYAILTVSALLQFFVKLFFHTPSAAALLFPRYTVLQITIAISWPVQLKKRQMYVNNGFQFNYQMPYNLTFFTKPMFVADTRTFTAEITDKLRENVSNQADDENEKYRNIREIDFSKYNQGRSDGARNRNVDFTAGELYSSMEDVLTDAGYDKTCILKSVCQLARHPFNIDYGSGERSNKLEIDDTEENHDEHLLAEVVHFFLTPSVHQGFGTNEEYLKDKYEMAESIGRNENDCDSIYSQCKMSILDHISYIK